MGVCVPILVFTCVGIPGRPRVCVWIRLSAQMRVCTPGSAGRCIWTSTKAQVCVDVATLCMDLYVCTRPCVCPHVSEHIHVYL